MSVCDNTTVNQKAPLKLQSIRKTKTCHNACKKTFNNPIIRQYRGIYKKKYNGIYKKSTAVPVLGTKYRRYRY